MRAKRGKKPDRVCEGKTQENTQRKGRKEGNKKIKKRRGRRKNGYDKKKKADEGHTIRKRVKSTDIDKEEEREGRRARESKR